MYFLGHLQFCLKDSQEACPTFKCAILPGTKPTLSEWITCCRSEGEIGFEHVTYHKLTDSDKSLSIILAKYSNSNICGIIIINSTNSVSLSDDIAIKEGDILMPPVYVVSLEDGCELETFIGAREKQSVLIRVVVDITVDMPVDHDPKTVQRVPQSLCFCSMYLYQCYKQCWVTHISFRSLCLYLLYTDCSIKTKIATCTLHNYVNLLH